ncbi:MAG: hypothetical protein ABWZ25_17515 [Chitinophagaceae bacterium]
MSAFCDEHLAAILEEQERLYRLIRWKHRLGERKETQLNLTMEWCLDKKSWGNFVSCSSAENLRVSSTHRRPLESSIEKLFDDQQDEPVFLDMLRQANSIRSGNLEPSFVIAVAAMEVGVKFLIQNRQPATKWLVEELPSPPIIRLVQEYLPKIVKEFVVKEEDKAMIKNIVEARNKIVHRGGSVNERKTLYKWLNYINDFLFHRIGPLIQ